MAVHGPASAVLERVEAPPCAPGPQARRLHRALLAGCAAASAASDSGPRGAFGRRQVCWPGGVRPGTPGHCCSSFRVGLSLRSLSAFRQGSPIAPSPHRRRIADALLWSSAGCVLWLVLITRETASSPSSVDSWVLATAVRWSFEASLGRFPAGHASERAVIVGDGALADAARRKLRIFPDIHAELVTETGRSRITSRKSSPHGKSTDSSWLRVPIARRISRNSLGCAVPARSKLSVIPPARGMFGTAAQLNASASSRCSSTTPGTSRVRRC